MLVKMVFNVRIVVGCSVGISIFMIGTFKFFPLYIGHYLSACNCLKEICSMNEV